LVLQASGGAVEEIAYLGGVLAADVISVSRSIYSKLGAQNAWQAGALAGAQLGFLTTAGEARSALSELFEPLRRTRPPVEKIGSFKANDLQLLRLLADGLTLAEVAAVIQRSPTTVSNRLRQVYSKLRGAGLPSGWRTPEAPAGRPIYLEEETPEAAVQCAFRLEMGLIAARPSSQQIDILQRRAAGQSLESIAEGLHLSLRETTLRWNMACHRLQMPTSSTAKDLLSRIQTIEEAEIHAGERE